MRDLLNDLADDAAQNPVDRARALSKRELPKRFYKSVAVGAGDGEGGAAHSILLDGRPCGQRRATRFRWTTPRLPG